MMVTAEYAMKNRKRDCGDSGVTVAIISVTVAIISIIAAIIAPVLVVGLRCAVRAFHPVA
jgi:Tfp pilus assembly protein FimT